MSDGIGSLLPDGVGHQFVLYGDSCSGVAGQIHAENLKKINSVIANLSATPEFILFPGDEIIGLTDDEAELRGEWRRFFEEEMAWLDREAVPLYHTTGNHTAYNAMSERVFADVMAHLPRNGPADQQGLSYFVRHGDLLLVFVNTMWSGLGGEGHVETEWLEECLGANTDARWRFVIGHHPVFPVNGYSGPCQRTIASEHAGEFWRILVKYGVFAYLCSHILAFDVQVHDGILQITTAGAGTAHRMPADVEYLHGVQAAIDENGLRYQVFDETGQVRERLSWPPSLPPSSNWRRLESGMQGALVSEQSPDNLPALRIAGRTSPEPMGEPQAFLAAWSDKASLSPLWIGLSGQHQRLTVIIGPTPRRSPHYWFGPALGSNSPFDLQLALHGGMGPGGVMWRRDDGSPWSSLEAASAWGLERLAWPQYWSVGHDKGDARNAPFRGSDLSIRLSTAEPLQQS